MSASDEWKKELEANHLSNNYLDSRQTRKYLDTQYNEVRDMLIDLGLAKSAQTVATTTGATQMINATKSEQRSYFFNFEALPPHTFTKHTTSNGSVVTGDTLIVGLVNKPRGSGSQPHRHPFEQFNYVIKGKLKACVGGQERVVGPGGLIHIPANTLHTIVATPEEDAVFFMVKEKTPMGTAGIPEDPNVTSPRYEPGFGPQA